MSSLYFIGGIMHLIKPRIYLRIMPRYLPKPKLLVFLSGIAELLIAAGLIFNKTRELAIYSLILMLLVFLLVHFYMLSSQKAAAGFPRWILIARIPLQFILMLWAFSYL
ncbi:hypothetical protein [Christiangramia aquimixticola]|uniref:DoxX family protein n=1 Tax=Christiangramia aquimixticola TaxID=1697558 RepID=UPI003AA950DC